MSGSDIAQFVLAVIVIYILIIMTLEIFPGLKQKFNKLRGKKAYMPPPVVVKTGAAAKPGCGKKPSNCYDSLISKTLSENNQFYSDPKEEINMTSENVEGNNSVNNYAKWEFGPQGTSYSDYVASQAIDDKVIQYHTQFVKDRKGLGPGGEFITGRTYSPDSHDSYDPIPWVGIRGRPQYVEQCNPTQVPDLDTNLFKGHRPFVIWT